ncbi:alpha/beta-hydrolase [Xylariaceae sp. FL1272]|nr:alpha/beta-hydrolase [Xylariaceae sp. FL1272]
MSSLLRLLSYAVLLAVAAAESSFNIRFVQNGTSTTTKSIITTDGYTYVYDYAAPKNASMPTFLLIHGYPASRHDWHHQVPALIEAGYGVLVPDCLGYGDSSKPTAVEAYNLKDMAGHMTQLLDAENLDSVIGVGHDWGSSVLGRSAVYYPDRFSKLAFLSYGYAPPGYLLDIDGINESYLKSDGYTPVGYWYFFNTWDATDIISANLESYFHLLYHTDSLAWGKDFAQIAASRAWLGANTTTALPSWISLEEKALWLQIYSQPDTVVATINYYRALLRGVQAADEIALTDEQRMLRVPVITIGGSQDLVTRADLLSGSEAWASAGYEQHVVDAGHWIYLEQADEVTRILLEFADSN